MSVWHQAEKVRTFPAESVGISASLPDGGSLCHMLFLHSSPGKMGVFLSIKIGVKTMYPHRCSSTHRDS